MLMQIYKENICVCTVTNAAIIPRLDETIKIYKTTLKVKDVIWHISEEKTWIEIQVK